MDWELRQLIERQKISDLLHDYCRNIDTKQLEKMDEVFTSDCKADYGRDVGDVDGLTSLQQMLGRVLTQFAATSHNVCSTRVVFEGPDAAAGVSYVIAYRAFKSGQRDGVIYGLYQDRFALTDRGWRISQRKFVTLGQQGPPTQRHPTE